MREGPDSPSPVAKSAAWRRHAQRNHAGSSRLRHGVALSARGTAAGRAPNPAPRTQAQTPPLPLAGAPARGGRAQPGATNAGPDPTTLHRLARP